ncbi:class I SAM-dependent methyltransferase [Paenibacillus chitinolyticus]|uniref:Class I SAM-dependent methyltransferase n=1 Tax=Paenibacillus chitinolyticus TaxID=79263 RepID=A0A410X290_9BACL|nr:class I SAM-dependent methyltransferase [Paenibacillus chitinolyticus]MCY9593564.1 methyltransferase domain-containing protein [Paenibacillus chitinolyticus]MCY9597535.1 methyltransferase domain-containing protein [Paenibacillus chitinolyticus]QAV20732.1 class I SAM-dependent methyltransferase [Paenibacillus chitinolyticus]
MKVKSAWYRESFGKDYLLVYKHRNFEGAYAEVKRMMNWLHLPEGARVLDLCCGMGRHSLALADFGYTVTGIDLSDTLLGEARKQDPEERVTWLHGDMRRVPSEESFHAVVNLFTSFGYFEQEEENRLVLSEIARLLQPDGKFIIDYLNPAYVKTNLVPHSSREENGLFIEETRSIENGYVRKQICITDNQDGPRHYSEQVRLYSCEAFVDMLYTAGLRVERIYGSYDGKDYDRESSPRMIFVGGREGESLQ